jgi:hypothetical protein
MWLLAGTIFIGCKWLTWTRTPVRNVRSWQHAAYLLAWPGLDAKAFLRTDRLPPDQRPSFREWAAGAMKFLLGAIIFWGVTRWVPEDQIILLGWAGMIGLVMMLHFGAFHLLSCFWRAIGIEARPLMNSPLASVSVSEFWGKRWNTAFRDLTHRFLFRPLIAKLGPRWALWIGFVISGLVHDLVISIPAGGGYGWPTLFFVIQGSALLIERTRVGQTVGLGQGWRGGLFTELVLLIPAYKLFHPPFVRNVIVPFMKALGAV